MSILFSVLNLCQDFVNVASKIMAIVVFIDLERKFELPKSRLGAPAVSALDLGTQTCGLSSSSTNCRVDVRVLPASLRDNDNDSLDARVLPNYLTDVDD